MQTETTPKPSTNLTKLAGLLLFLALGAGTEWLLSTFRQQESSGQKGRAFSQSEHVRARLEGELNTVVFLSNGLAGFLSFRHDSDSSGEIRDILAETFRHSRHVSSFAVARGYRVAHVFPQDDTRQAIGFDYRNQSDLLPSVQNCIETRAPLLAGPQPPSRRLTYLVPIFVGGQFWGLLSTLVNDSSLFSAAGLSQANSEYQYALRTQSADAAHGELILGTADLFDDPQAAITNIAVPGGGWRLAVKSASPPVDEAWFIIQRGLGWLLASLFAAQSVALITLRRRLSDLSLYDRLTGLPGRHLFVDRLKQMIRRTKRNRGNFSVVFASLNDFKLINNAQGHKVGDMMLAGIGKRLIGSIRHCDTVTRWGGDEFLVLLDACPLDQANIIAENLRHKIELPVSYGEKELRIPASIGLASYPEDGHSLTALLKVAETRMRLDKSRRKA